MDERIVRFVSALRSSGVRVSLAESQDSLAAVEKLGVSQRDIFKAGLKTTLIKEHRSEPIFERLFPIFFNGSQGAITPVADVLSASEMQELMDALSGLAQQMESLLGELLQGRGPASEEVRQAMQEAGLDKTRSMGDFQRLLRKTKRRLGLEKLLQQIHQLLEQLADQGLDPGALQELETLMLQNLSVLREQIGQQVGLAIADHLSRQQERKPAENNLLDQPFSAMRGRDFQRLGEEVARIAARLRTRAALRQKRGKGSALDVKGTLRANIRNQGIPFEIVHKVRRKKPRFTILCDVSTSMRPVVSFLLTLVYQLHDRVSRTRSFAFINQIQEISGEFATAKPENAISTVLRNIPAGHYNTDLGYSLDQFSTQYLESVDFRTTLIICGDGRNNHNNPRLDLIDALHRRSRKLVWFNPESPNAWGSGDSDMLAYSSLVDQVYQVANLRQLSHAVDQLFL
jgi:uncharacterized protein